MSLKQSLVMFLAVTTAWVTSAHGQAVIRPGDVFDLRASGMPQEYANQLSLPYTVADDGNVDLPYIGTMKAGGLSTTAFTRAVEKKYIAEKIFTHPTIVVNLSVASRFVTVGGSVRGPGTVTWTPDLTLNQAIMQRGGGDEFWHQRAKVTRDGKAYVFNLKIKDKDPSQNPKLLPGDEIEVQ